MKEEIRVIPWTNGEYGVSNLGNVYSYKSGETKLLRAFIQNGYYKVNLHFGGTRGKFLVHRLVAEIFIPNPENLKQVNHKDECKTNNKVENLEWCTQQYNLNYGTHNKRAGIGHRKKIVQLDSNNRTIRIFESRKHAAEFFGLSDSYIGNMITGRKTNKFNLNYI